MNVFLKKLFLAVLIGAALTFVSYFYAQRESSFDSLPCDLPSNCPLSVRLVDITSRGFPMKYIETTYANGYTTGGESNYYISNAIIDWIIFSAVAYIPLHFFIRNKQIYPTDNTHKS